MFPGRNVLTGVASAVLLFAAFVAVPSSALAAPVATPTASATITPSSTPTPSPTPTATATAAATPTAMPRSALGNISTRALVGLGDDVLIAGFIVTGTQPKKVIIRAIGPSLPLAGHLDNPTLELVDSSGTLLDSNDDWVNSPNKQAIMDSAVAPMNDLESAIVATLPAMEASYTAIVRGVNGGTGIGVVEVYDLDFAADSSLANISTRGLVSGGDNAMIAGTIIVESEPQKVIIRALGPSLPVAHKLADPTLELRDASGTVLTNDDWGENSDADKLEIIMTSGLAPTDPRESAIVATLPAGNATAIVGDAAAIDTGRERDACFDRNPSPGWDGSHRGNSARSSSPAFQSAAASSSVFTRPTSIISGQPGDKAALEDSITIPWNANADDIKAAILASDKFYRYDQNNNLTAGPFPFHVLFDRGGGLGIAGNEGSRREPVITGSANDFTIQFGTLTEGAVGVTNPWVRQLPLVQVDASSLIYDGGIAVVEIYAVPDK